MTWEQLRHLDRLVCLPHTVRSVRTKRRAGARERILATARDLFYHNGYRATGVNEIIEKARVAKATFFAHFPTKENLAVAYLEGLHRQEAANLLAFVNQAESPKERFLAVIRWIDPWIRSNDLRGCGFLNIVPEAPDPRSPLRKQAKAHYEVLRGLLRDLAGDLVRSDPDAYGMLDPDRLADVTLLVLVGSIALSEISRDPWPARTGAQAVEALLAA